MATKLDQLREILSQQLDLYGQLLEINREKQEQVVGNRVDLVETAVKRESEILSQVETLEGRRSMVMVSLCGDLGIDPEETTLSTLAEMFDSSESSGLISLRDEIVSTLSDLRLQGEINERLIMDSLRYIDFALGLYFPEDDEDRTYRPDVKGGSGSKDKRRGLFDAKA